MIWWLACASPETVPVAEVAAAELVAADVDAAAAVVVPPPPPWPREGARLRPPAVDAPADFGVRTVFLDPGHGADGNPGNTNAFCEPEQDVMLRIARDVAADLEATGLFDVVLARDGELVGYRDRVAAAEAAGAEVFVSLHSDAREDAGEWEPSPGQRCPVRDDSPGFTVLWSDEGDLADRRASLARSVAGRMLEAGFPAYSGVDYEGAYAAMDGHPGVFVDRHAMARRILVLRRPAMPSIIVETHHAWDVAEASRWTEPETTRAFSGALAAALVDFLR